MRRSAPFKEFTDIHDVTLILVHHTRKNTESENSFDRISGTNGLLGAADGAFLLYREKGPCDSGPDREGSAGTADDPGL